MIERPGKISQFITIGRNVDTMRKIAGERNGLCRLCHTRQRMQGTLSDDATSHKGNRDADKINRDQDEAEVLDRAIDPLEGSDGFNVPCCSAIAIKRDDIVAPALTGRGETVSYTHLTLPTNREV